MKTKAVLILVFLGLMGLVCLGNDGVPKAISPGIAGGIGVVEDRCPTFSWSGVAWAEKYRVVVFGVEDAVAQIEGEIKLTARPLLSEDIAGGLSWTPSVSQGLTEGFDYAWYVGAMDVAGAWAWSESRRFRVEANAKLTLIEGDTSGQKQPVRKAEANDKAALPAAAGSAAGTAAGKKGKANDPAYGSEGTLSTFYGTGAGANNSSDNNANSFFGSGAGCSNTDGMDNTFMGSAAGNWNTASNNTFIGYYAGFYNSTGTPNVFIGYEAGRYSTGSSNIFIGNDSGFNNNGNYNTYIGHTSGYSNTSGTHNTYVGLQCGYSQTSGISNTMMGVNAGYYNVTGGSNTFIGRDAGYQNTGENNTYLGAGTGANSAAGSRNIFIGMQAGYNETGSDKLYIDSSSTASPLIYGDFATDKVGINGWLGVGTSTPVYPIELKTTGRNATFMATQTDGASNFINATATYGQFGTKNNYPVRILVNSNWRMALNTDNSLTMASGATCTAAGKWIDSSSRALKENIRDLGTAEAQAALQDLNPVCFTYKADKVEEQVGFIAEDVPELVATRGRKGMSAMDVVAVLTKVTQEQQKTIEKLTRNMQLQQQSIEKMKKEIAGLKKQRSK